jgi:predicted RecB family nuclease
MQDIRHLTDLRGVGPSIASDLRDLGISTIGQLAASNGRALYDRLCAQTGVRQDPCVEDTFVCAVAQARDPELPVEQKNWWYWSRLRKRGATHLPEKQLAGRK